MSFESVELLGMVATLIILCFGLALYYKIIKPLLVKCEVETRKSIYELVLYRKFAKSKGIDIEDEYKEYYASSSNKSNHEIEFEEFKEDFEKPKDSEE